jgi:hypothetical protein
MQKVPGTKSTLILCHETPDEFPMCTASQMPTEHIKAGRYKLLFPRRCKGMDWTDYQGEQDSQDSIFDAGHFGYSYGPTCE